MGTPFANSFNDLYFEDFCAGARKTSALYLLRSRSLINRSFESTLFEWFEGVCALARAQERLSARDSKAERRCVGCQLIACWL